MRYGGWRGKALVADPRDGKQRTISLDIVAQAPDRLRIDVTSTLGIYVGTFVTADRRFSWLSALEKKFVTGPAESKAARDMLRLPIDPRDVIALLFEAPLGKTWSCEGAEAARRCVRRADGATVDLTRDGDARRWAVQSGAGGAAAQLRLEPSSPNGQPPDKTFALAKPRGFAELDVSP